MLLSPQAPGSQIRISGSMAELVMPYRLPEFVCPRVRLMIVTVHPEEPKPVWMGANAAQHRGAARAGLGSAWDHWKERGGSGG